MWQCQNLLGIPAWLPLALVSNARIMKTKIHLFYTFTPVSQWYNSFGYFFSCVMREYAVYYGNENNNFICVYICFKPSYRHVPVSWSMIHTAVPMTTKKLPLYCLLQTTASANWQNLKVPQNCHYIHSIAVPQLWLWTRL